MLTGGSSTGSDVLSSSVLYPGGCSVPSMESGREGHVTFITQDTNPRIAICGGWDGWNYKKDCLVLRNGGWIGEELDDMPDKRTFSASARLDAGVFILGGSGNETRPNKKSAYFLKARVLVVQTPQTICNFPQKDCLRTRKLSVSVPES